MVYTAALQLQRFPIEQKSLVGAKLQAADAKASGSRIRYPSGREQLGLYPIKRW